jgi:dihydrofolate reductase
MSLSLIVAVASNGAIGYQNQLPWSLPEDLRYFKRVTLGHRLIMGRNTFFSLKKPLPGRQNVVLSRSSLDLPEDVIQCESITQALELPQWGEYSDVICIGGAQLYAAVLPMAQTLYMTEIEREVEGDAFFPAWNRSEWECVSREAGEACPEGWSYSFVTYRRIVPSEKNS